MICSSVVCLRCFAAGDPNHPVKDEILDEISGAADLKAPDCGRLHMRTPSGFAGPALDEEQNAPVIERLMQLVAQAARLLERVANQALLRLPERLLFAGCCNRNRNDGQW